MLVFRILSTVFIGISYITLMMKNVVLFSDDTKMDRFACWTLWGVAWRTFIIVSIWLI